MPAVDAEFGVRLPVAGPLAGASAIVAVATASERLGFGHVSVHDFIAWSNFQDRTHISCGSVEVVDAAGPAGPANFYESLQSLAFTAGVTKSIRLLLSVLALPYRNPIVAAKQIATLDCLSGGRLVLGIGVGASTATHNSDFELLGVPRSDKYSRTLDYFRGMQALWTHDRPAYSGRFVQFGPTQMDPKPVQRPYPPIWVGGGGPKSVAIAAEIGDGWIPPWLAPQEYPARIAELNRQAESYRRGPLTVATTMPALIAETDEEARRLAGPSLSVMTTGFAADATPEAIDRSGLIGSPGSIAKRVREYQAAGISAFELRFIYQSLDHLLDQLGMFASRVIAML